MTWQTNEVSRSFLKTKTLQYQKVECRLRINVFIIAMYRPVLSFGVEDSVRSPDTTLTP